MIQSLDELVLLTHVCFNKTLEFSLVSIFGFIFHWLAYNNLSRYNFEKLLKLTGQEIETLSVVFLKLIKLIFKVQNCYDNKFLKFKI